MKDQDKTRDQLVGELTELRQRVATLEASERRYRTIIDTVPLTIGEINRDGTVVFANTATEKMYGYPPEEIVGSKSWDRIEEGPAREAFRTWFSRTMLEQPPLSPVFGSRIKKNGERIQIQGECNYLRNEVGEVTGLVTVVADITERKRTEEALRQSEERFRLLVEQAIDGIFVSTAQGRYLDVNGAGCEMLGYSREEILARTIADVVAAEEVPRIATEIARFAGGMVTRSEWRFRRKDGSFFTGEVVGCQLPDGRLQGILRDITDRKQAEEALRVNEERMRQAVRAANLGVFEHDHRTDVIQWSAEMRQIYGIGPEEPVSISAILDFYHPDDREGVAAAIQRAHDPTGDGIYSADSRIIRRDGTVRWLIRRSKTFFDSQAGIQRPIRTVGVVMDITDRRQAEEELRKAHDELEQRVEERTAELQKANEELTLFHRFAEASRQGFGMANMDGFFTYMNRAGCRTVGVAKPEDVIGKHLTTYYPKGYMLRRETEILPALLQDGHWEGELVFPSAGKTMYVLQNSFLIEDDNGNPSCIASVTTDITERKRIEEALRAREERFRSYFEQGLIGMAVSLPDRRWIQVNDRYCEMLGYSREELLGMKWTDLTHPDDLERNLIPLNRALAGESEHHTLEKRFIRKDGSIMYATVFARCFRRQDGSVDHFLSLIEDITGRKLAQEALERERQSLWRMLQASDHERQTISYEIHDGLAQYLAGATMQFQVHDSLKEGSPKKARKAYETAVELVRQSHAESRRLISEVRPPIIDENGIEMAISHLVFEQRRHGGPKIELHSSVQFGRLPSILENALYRIAQEALTNACKHSKSKKVTVTMTQEGQDVRLEVRDWGIGFDPESVEKGHFGVEGIRQRVRLLGGQLTIESKPGSGTLVQVVVPIVERQSEE